ncbi:MAG: FtsQ-type POTRA domain-containing protein [Alphaproteobacteria bacterium]|nr:FtsQ-type POTRA domain-containing protein [Alphaproteobacteria bacterium]
MRLSKAQDAKAKNYKSRRTKANAWKIALMLDVLVISLLSVTGFYLWHKGTFASFARYMGHQQSIVSQAMGLTLQHIYVDGLHHIKPQTIHKIINTPKGSPLLSLSLKDIQSEIEHFYWVDHATIERQFPHTLHVHITERTPMAVWQHQQKLILVDKKGDIIPEPNIDAYADLLMLVGEDAPKHASELFSLLSIDPTFSAMVHSAIWVSNRRWNIRLTNGIEVKLPEANVEESWRRLIDIYYHQKLDKHPVTSVDLRIPGKLYIRIRPKTQQIQNAEEAG